MGFQWLSAVKRRLSEARSGLGQPASWLVEALAGSSSWSGVPVGVEDSLTVAPWWAAVQLLSRDVAKLPLTVYRRLPNDGRERDDSHAAYRLLRSDPSPEFTALQFKQLLTAWALLHGNGFAFIFRDPAGRPRELLPLSPTNTKPVRDRETGQLFYDTRLRPGDDPRRLDPDDVLHIRGLSLDGTCGISVVQKAANCLGTQLAAAQHSARFFKNNARPDFVVEVPQPLPDRKVTALVEQFDRQNRGLTEAHRPAILTGGAKIRPLTFSAADMQLIAMLRFGIAEVANFMGIPPHMLGDDSRTSFKSLEEEARRYLSQALDGWLTTWEAECNRKLLSSRQRASDTHFAEFNRSALLRADLETRSKAYHLALQSGWMTSNEVRALENLNPIEGGDELRVPMNMESTSAPQPEPRPGRGLGGPARRLVARGVERIARRAASMAERRSKQPGYREWLVDQLELAMRPAFKDELRDAFEVLAVVQPSIDPAAALDQAADAVFARLRDDLADLAGAVDASFQQRFARDVTGRLLGNN